MHEIRTCKCFEPEGIRVYEEWEREGMVISLSHSE